MVIESANSQVGMSLVVGLFPGLPSELRSVPSKPIVGNPAAYDGRLVKTPVNPSEEIWLSVAAGAPWIATECK